MQTIEALKMGFDSGVFFEVLFIYFVNKKRGLWMCREWDVVWVKFGSGRGMKWIFRGEYE